MASKKVDKLFLIVFSILSTGGFFILAATSVPFALKNTGNGWFYIRHQLLLGFLPGLFLILIFLKLDFKKLKKASFILFLLNISLLLLIFLPGVGLKIKGARRWINFAGVTFQPAEFLKLTFLFYLSAWLANNLKNNKGIKWKPLVVYLVSGGFLALLFFLQNDLSTFFIIAISSLAVYFFSKTPVWQTALIVFLVIILVSMFIFFSPMRAARIKSVFDSQADLMGSGYQLKQAKITIGSGGVFGANGGFDFGMSQQKLGFLPEAMTDSIFAIVGEEFGFFGSIILVILFFIFGWEGIKIGLKEKDSFLKFLAIGLSFWISAQGLINIAGNIGIMPLAGIPLPFFSYGASHLVVELAAGGIILNISRR